MPNACRGDLCRTISVLICFPRVHANDDCKSHESKENDLRDILVPFMNAVTVCFRETLASHIFSLHCLTACVSYAKGRRASFTDSCVSQLRKMKDVPDYFHPQQLDDAIVEGVFPESTSLSSRICDGDVFGPEMIQAAKQGVRDASHYVALATHVVQCNCHPMRTAAAGMTCVVDRTGSFFTLSDASGLLARVTVPSEQHARGEWSCADWIYLQLAILSMPGSHHIPSDLHACQAGTWSLDLISSQVLLTVNSHMPRFSSYRTDQARSDVGEHTFRIPSLSGKIGHHAAPYPQIAVLEEVGVGKRPLSSKGVCLFFLDSVDKITVIPMRPWQGTFYRTRGTSILGFSYSRMLLEASSPAIDSWRRNDVSMERLQSLMSFIRVTAHGYTMRSKSGERYVLARSLCSSLCDTSCRYPVLRRDSICLEEAMPAQGAVSYVPLSLVGLVGDLASFLPIICSFAIIVSGAAVDEWGKVALAVEIVAEISSRFVVSALWSNQGPAGPGLWLSVLAPVLWSSTVFDASRVSIGLLWVCPLTLEVVSCAVSTFVFMSSMDSRFPWAIVSVSFSALTYALKMPVYVTFFLLALIFLVSGGIVQVAVIWSVYPRLAVVSGLGTLAECWYVAVSLTHLVYVTSGEFSTSKLSSFVSGTTPCGLLMVLAHVNPKVAEVCDGLITAVSRDGVVHGLPLSRLLGAGLTGCSLVELEPVGGRMRFGLHSEGECIGVLIRSVVCRTGTVEYPACSSGGKICSLTPDGLMSMVEVGDDLVPVFGVGP